MKVRVALLALAAIVPAAAEPVDAGRLDQMVDDVLAAREYRHLLRFRETELPPRSASERRTQAPAKPAPERTEGGQRPLNLALPDLSGLAGLLRIVVYAALAGALVWVLVLLTRLARGREPGPAQPDSFEVAAGPPGESLPDDSVRQALVHARAGRHREAIRLLLLGGLSTIERRGLIRYRKGLTNRDYLRAAGREPALRNALEGIVLAFDEVHFGRREATAQRFEECLNHYRTGLARS